MGETQKQRMSGRQERSQASQGGQQGKGQLTGGASGEGSLEEEEEPRVEVGSLQGAM